MEADRRQPGLSEGPWAARLHRTSAVATATALRLRADVVGCFIDDQLWLRGPQTDESLDRALRLLCPVTRFTIRPGSERDLIRLGQLLPSQRLPQANWTALGALFPLERPTAALPATRPAAIVISVVRGGVERPATMLLSTLPDWAAYADVAPAIRLQRLRFAATSTHALIAGEPLPPIRGTRLWERDGVVVPCGCEIAPAVDSATLRRVLGLREDEVALFREEGAWELIPPDAFVLARRSAVRLTARSEAS